MKKYDNGPTILLQGDSSPHNTFFANDDQAILIDWEHAGISKNKLLATIYDYGNMRARSWSNEEYCKALDLAIIDRFETLGDKKAGEAVVALGIFRSHCCLAGFFENYPREKQIEKAEEDRKKATEEDIKKAFAIAGIEI